MNDEIVIRLFDEKDLDEVYEMIQRSLSTYVIQKVYEEKTLAIWSSFYSKKYIAGAAKLKHLYVASLEGKIVGTAACEPMEDNVYISMVYIDPNVQGKGIGKRLLMRLEQDEYCKNAKLLTMTAALSAIKFYQKYGYHYCDNLPEIVLDCGIEFMHMEKIARV